MALSDSLESLKARIVAGLSWKSSIVEDFYSAEGLPAIVVGVVGGGGAAVLSGAVRQWDLGIELRVPIEQMADLEYHRDPNGEGLAGVVNRADIIGASLIKPEITKGVLRDDDQMGIQEYAWLRIDYEMYVS